MRNSSSQKQAITFAIASLVTFIDAAPVIPGLHAEHPLSEAEKGTVLIEELRCAACHEGIATGPALSAPELKNVRSRLNPDFIRNFIANPSAHDRGTAMPDVLGTRSDEEKAELSAALSAYLISLGEKAVEPTAEPESGAESGKELFHKTGCVACHSPQDEADIDPHGKVGLDHIAAKYRPSGLASFLHTPLKVRPSGRMPDMLLSRREAELLAAFLIGPEGGQTAHSKAKSTAEQIAAGKKAFSALGCVSCHQVEDEASSSLQSPPFSKLDLEKGCLSEAPGNAPDYQLGDEQRAAIRSALSKQPARPDPALAVKIRLTQLNCISCHQRDDYGGVSPDLDTYFHSTQEALGNESRIPPPLTLTGAKLRPEWMNKVLYERESVRPYMTTRMPQFGREALEGLTELFGETDKLEPFEYEPLDKQSEPMLRDGAHMLLGDQGLNCIACHNYNGKESPGMKGLDLMTSYQRLQPAWFDQFMRNPGKFRPGIIMPSFWPDGKALQTEILDGNSEDQLRALWHNFSLGRSARDPSGLREEDPELIVTDKAITYRGRSNVAGYRGIAVGYPGGLNYAFNAQNGALSAIWKDGFVTVGWRGQGSGNFNPKGRVIQLAQDVAFLKDAATPWPLAPQRSKEVPVNPDPLYPRQYGYAFQGYSIAENGVPTFRYKTGDVSIEDVSAVITDGPGPVLRRTLSFTAPEATTLHFRALTGKIEEVSSSVFRNDDLRLTRGEGDAFSSAELRDAAGEKTGKELIFTLKLPAGTSTQTIEYAPLR